MRIQETKVYTYDELSDKAKEKARNWYREGNLDYDWWDCSYEDFANRAQELGIDLRQKPVKLMNGKTRYVPEIYFSGFYHQNSGSSFAGTWRASDMKLEALKEECPTEAELHRIGAELESVVKEDAEMSASITAHRDNWIRVEVEDGETIAEQLNELEYKSPEYITLAEACKNREETVIDAMRDFNHWIYKRLEAEYEWLNADEQVEESIRCNEYEFTEDGHIA